jgi:hypothetical protein
MSEPINHDALGSLGEYRFSHEDFLNARDEAELIKLGRYWEKVFDICLGHVERPDELVRWLAFLQEQQHPDRAARRDASKRRDQFYKDNKHNKTGDPPGRLMTFEDFSAIANK